MNSFCVCVLNYLFLSSKLDCCLRICLFSLLALDKNLPEVIFNSNLIIISSFF